MSGLSPESEIRSDHHRLRLTINMKKAIFNKKPKKSLGYPAKHLLLGIPTNIRELIDPVPLDENNPEPSRIESVKRESEAPNPPIAGSSTVVAIADIEQGGRLMSEYHQSSSYRQTFT
jgi:hypothetical protein